MSEYIINDEQIAENRRLHGKKLLVMPVIVRCHDCEYYGNNGYDNGYCYYWNTCDFGELIREPDDYCSRGSRREDQLWHLMTSD